MGFVVVITSGEHGPTVSGGGSKQSDLALN
jgi:hypothetical protein